jgi:DNA repair protein RecO (recombination protein O)
MSDIIKTEAIVLRKINFGDSSRIALFYSKDFGKISGIIKGARSSKFKIGSMVDTINLLQLVLYKKDSREVQLISEVDLIKHYSHIKDDYQKLKYATAIIELLTTMTSENEHNVKLFDGTVRILSLLEGTDENPQFLFIKYFFFFLKEIGYEFQIEHCNICGKKINPGEQASYNYEIGIMCSECCKDRLTNFNFTEELFELLTCLNSKRNNALYKEKDLDLIMKMLEKFLMYQLHEFKGLKSFNLN